MATSPRATTTVDDTSGAAASGTDLICVIAPVSANADAVPRQYGSAAAVHTKHGFSRGVEYVALHAQRTRKPFVFVGVEIAVEGVIEREDVTGNSGTSDTTLTPGASGVLAEHDGELTVFKGGTVGTDQIQLGLSLDGGRTTKRVRLGTSTSYTIPYIDLAVGFTVGTLVEGDTIHTWHGTEPLADGDGIAAARAALAAQLRAFRSILLIGDCQTDNDAQAFLDELNAYETENTRFVYGRASVRDRKAAASLSSAGWRMAEGASLTFEDGADTITRDSGSWIDDGAKVGDIIEIDGSASNDGVGAPLKVTAVSNSVLTTSNGLVDEVDATGVTITGETGLQFTNVGETIRRSRGSWLADGFRVGDSVVIAGTAATTNDGTFVIASLTSVLMTLAAGGVDADEQIAASALTFTGPGAQSKSDWMADIDAAFASIDDAPRIDLAAGRAWVGSPFTGFDVSVPPSWGASIREYQHDLHIASWRKSDGPLPGFDLLDEDENLEQWDDRVDGGAGSAARFTTYTTYPNDRGTFITQSLTRALDGSKLSYTHNESVVNLACTIVQRATENFIGETPIVDDDGHAITDALNTMQTVVNAALELGLLQNARGEGPRAGKAVWTPSADDDLSVPEAHLTGVLDLNIRGTIHSVDTRTRVN